MVNEMIGDNKEFPITDMSAGDVTVYLYNTDSYDSSNDTATTKYMNTSRPRTEFCLRTDNVVKIVQLGNVTFTDPLTCPANGSITETELQDSRHIANFDRIVIRPTQDNTNVKLRVRG